MANNYSMGSVIIPCTEKTRDEFLEHYKDIPELQSETAIIENNYESDAKGVWISGDEGFDLEEAASAAQWLLKRDGSTAAVRIESALTCSKLRVDEFGGAVAIVTAENAWFMNTGSWLPDELRQQTIGD